MKPILLLLGLFTFSVSVTAQYRESRHFENVKIGLYYSQDRFLKQEEFFSINEDYGAYYGEVNYDQPMYRLGFSMDFPIRRNFSVLTGIGYQKWGFSAISYHWLSATEHTYSGLEKSQFEFLNIPLIGQVIHQCKHLNIIGQLGVVNQLEFGHLLKGNYVVSATGGLGVEKEFGRALAINLIADYSQNINYVFRGWNDYKLQIMGLKLGMTYKI